MGCLFRETRLAGGDAARLDALSGEYGRAGFAAEAATRDKRFARAYTREVLQSRALLEKGLTRLGARVYPSAANFVLADFGPDARRLVRGLERQGILVRERKDFPRTGFVRISAGTLSDTRRVLRAMEGIL